MSDTELKPCPFCGGEAEEALCDWEPAIRCKSCHATVYREYLKQAEHAEVIMWNTRKPMERIVAQLKDEAELSYADFEGYVAEYGLDAEYDDDFRYGMRRAIGIVQKGGAE